MAYKIVLARPALEDIAQSVDFIKSTSPSAANQWLDEIQQTVQSLKEMPFRAPIIPESELLGIKYRQLLFHSYRIVFRIDEAQDTVIIVRVYHAARPPLEPDEIP